MSAQRRLGIWVILLMMVATLAATVAIAWLVVPVELRTEQFRFAMAFVLFAEVVTFLWPAWESTRNIERSSTFPFNLGMGSILFVYDVGVVLVLAASFLQPPMFWLVAAHIGWSLLLLLAAGVWVLGSANVAGEAARTQQSRRFQSRVRQEFDALVAGLVARGIGSATPLGKILAELADDIAHAPQRSTGQSLPAEEALVRALDALSANCRLAAAGDQAAVATAIEQAREMRALMAQRNELAKHKA